MSATRLLNTLLHVKHISRCETSTHRDDVFIPEHEPERKSRDTPTHGGSVISFWVEDRGLSFFLAFLVLVTIFVPMIRWSRFGRIGVGLMFALMLFSGAVATIRQRTLTVLVIAVTVLEFAADLIVKFIPSLGHWGWDTAFKISDLAILVVMTLKHTFRPGPISLHRVMGGVAAYLLIGLTWAFGYKLLTEARPEPIHFRTFVGEIPTGEPSRLIDFSFCTLTSVGYGDAYPVHRMARSLATARHWSGNCIPPF